MNNSQGNQRTKSNESYSSWEQIIFELPQGLVLRPVSFKIFLSNQFFSFLNFSINACENVDAVAETLRVSAEKLFKWLKDN